MTRRLSTLRHQAPRTGSHGPHRAVGLAAIVEALDRWDLVGVTSTDATLNPLGDWNVTPSRYVRHNELVVDWAHLSLEVPRDRTVIDQAVAMAGDLDGTRWLRRLVLNTVRDLGLDAVAFRQPATR